MTGMNPVIFAPSGGSGIRTHGELSPSTVFKTAAFNHSAIPPNLFFCENAHSIMGVRLPPALQALYTFWAFFILQNTSKGLAEAR